MKKFFEDFKAFINRGNVVDMAVGVVIATAFGNITKSLVADVIMPLISLATGKQSLAELRIVLKPDTLNEAGETVAGTYLNYGAFLQTVIDFLIIALCIFIVIRVAAIVSRHQDSNLTLASSSMSRLDSMITTAFR